MRPKTWDVFSAACFLLFLSSSALAGSDEDCLACHDDSNLRAEDGKSVYVNGEKFGASIHGKAEISCVDCHADLRKVKDFPHESKLKPVNCSECHAEAGEEFQKSIHARVGEITENALTVSCKDCHGTHEIRKKDDMESLIFPLNLPATCQKCHLEKVKTPRGSEFIQGYEKSVHFRALEKAGLTLSANCSHCHRAHEIKATGDPASRVSRKNIIQTCGQCHVGIKRDYMEGVHGKDYVKGNADIPVCTDCHSEHDILSPQDLNSKVYATKIAELCTRCHDNLTLSRQYGFLASRLKTYSETYHGTASKFGETRVANCASCHGYHDLRAASDPKSSINPTNLPKTCGKCHPGASKHFAEGQIHFVPENIVTAKHKSSLVVKNVYIIVISVFIAVFLIFIAADLLHRIIHRKTHE